jgi:hypothetical protein
VETADKHNVYHVRHSLPLQNKHSSLGQDAHGGSLFFLKFSAS